MIRWARSIQGRLIAGSVCSAVATLALATGFLYWVLVESLDEEDHEFLSARVQRLRSLLEERPDDRAALRQEITRELVYARGANYYVRVRDQDGHALIETPGMPIANASAFPLPAAAGSDPHPGAKRRSDDGRYYLLMAAWAPGGMKEAPQRRLELVLDRSREEAIIANYRQKLLVAVAVGVLVSAGAAIGTARAGLRPLHEIASAVERINAARLHERLGRASWPVELVALADAFDVMLGRLEDSFTRLSQFAGELAHELRTPIQVLGGEAEVALSRERTPDEYRDVLVSSLEEFARLSRVIERLLFLARADSAGMPLERRVFDVRGEIDAVTDFHRSLAEERGVTVRCQGNALVDADPLLVRQVVTNLLANALAYTPQDGSITIAVQTLPDRSVEISVTDTGVGIESERLPRVFDRFYRIDRTNDRYPRGTGLGLAIVKSIVDLHVGTIRIESVQGQGTTVRVTFPAGAAAQEI
jgi:two-component system heavy metal sensor histidine kinase CusS